MVAMAFVSMFQPYWYPPLAIFKLFDQNFISLILVLCVAAGKRAKSASRALVLAEFQTQIWNGHWLLGVCGKWSYQSIDGIQMCGMSLKYGESFMNCNQMGPSSQALKSRSRWLLERSNCWQPLRVGNHFSSVEVSRCRKQSYRPAKALWIASTWNKFSPQEVSVDWGRHTLEVLNQKCSLFRSDAAAGFFWFLPGFKLYCLYSPNNSWSYWCYCCRRWSGMARNITTTSRCPTYRMHHCAKLSSLLHCKHMGYVSKLDQNQLVSNFEGSVVWCRR